MADSPGAGDALDAQLAALRRDLVEFILREVRQGAIGAEPAISGAVQQAVTAAVRGVVDERLSAYEARRSAAVSQIIDEQVDQRFRLVIQRLEQMAARIEAPPVRRGEREPPAAPPTPAPPSTDEPPPFPLQTHTAEEEIRPRDRIHELLGPPRKATAPAEGRVRWLGLRPVELIAVVVLVLVLLGVLTTLFIQREAAPPTGQDAGLVQFAADAADARKAQAEAAAASLLDLEAVVARSGGAANAGAILDDAIRAADDLALAALAARSADPAGQGGRAAQQALAARNGLAALKTELGSGAPVAADDAARLASELKMRAASLRNAAEMVGPGEPARSAGS